MSAKDENLGGAAQNEAASGANATPQTPAVKGSNSDASKVQFNSADISKRKKAEFFIKIDNEAKIKRDKDRAAAKKEREARRDAAEIARIDAKAARKVADLKRNQELEAAEAERLQSRKEKIHKIFGEICKRKKKIITISVMVLFTILVAMLSIMIINKKAEKADSTDYARSMVEQYRNAQSEEEAEVLYEKIAEGYSEMDYSSMTNDDATKKIYEFCSYSTQIGKSDECIEIIVNNVQKIINSSEKENREYLSMICLWHDIDCYLSMGVSKEENE